LTKTLQDVTIFVRYHITFLHRRNIMGAIAVSEADEGQITELMRELGVKSKAQVVRAALRTLKERIDQEKLRSEIRESVKRCADADQRENRLLAPGGVARRG
jgi:Arc/MetJ family transcription regulator